MLDTGEAPRRELRLALEVGDETTVAYTADLDITQTSAQHRQRLDSPPITTEIHYEVTAVDPDGGATVDTSIEQVTVNPKGTGLSDDDVAAIEQAASNVEGLTGTATVSDRGQFSDIEFDAEDRDLIDQADTLAKAMAAFGPALPAEAVGVGAVWEAPRRTELGGVAVTQTVRTTITDLTDDAFTYTSTSTSTAGDARLEGTSTGTTSLTSLEYTLEATVEGTQSLTVTTDGEEVAVEQDLHLAYAVRPAGG